MVKNLLPLATTQVDDKGYDEWSRDHTLLGRADITVWFATKTGSLQVSRHDQLRSNGLFNLAADPTEQIQSSNLLGAGYQAS